MESRDELTFSRDACGCCWVDSVGEAGGPAQHQCSQRWTWWEGGRVNWVRGMYLEGICALPSLEDFGTRVSWVPSL